MSLHNKTNVNIPVEKPITKIDVITVFKGNYTGTVWFDDLRLIKGFVVTKNKYDDKGNYVIESKDELDYKVINMMIMEIKLTKKILKVKLKNIIMTHPTV